MFPVLQLGPLAVPTYPLAILIAGWLGLEVSARAAKRVGLDDNHIYNAAFSGLVAGLIVGRLAHVVEFWPAYRTQPLEIVGLNSRAFLLWPAATAGVAAWIWYVKRNRLPLARLLDAFAPGVLVAVAVADVGALLAGRDPGAPASLPWAVNLWGVSRHPAQLYEAVASLVVAAISWSVLARGTRSGTAAWVAVLGYGLAEWLLAPFRTDGHTVLGGFRVAQIAGLVIVLIALWALRPYSRAETSSQGDSG